eukprot:TRINITY_DN5297_c0_g2_i2.p1 TRINITY_DN5297_c0_g2~~TRINITY_DN5297_c0_g2_i2.p1  ORF type:complete len:104 (-),score=16.41 TRINITY_DN5297_c0_g2_i2:185-496(-)
MMYMPDCLKATIDILEADNAKLKSRSYNVAAVSFSPAQLAEAIKKRIPNFTITYKHNKLRQDIADSWPRSLDDSDARKDWGWSHTYDLDKMVDDMLVNIKKKI